MPIVPEKFEFEVAGLGVYIRVQVPLRLAWAITIHKCQGMSIDKLEVDISKCFAEGQVTAYIMPCTADSSYSDCIYPTVTAFILQ